MTATEVRIDFVSKLPRELSLHLLSFLGARDLLQLAKTSHHWRVNCEDDLLWRQKCEGAGIKELYDLDGDVGYLVPRSPWKRTLLIDRNWQFKEIEAKVLEFSEIDCYPHPEICSGNRFVTPSKNDIKVWSAITGKCLRTLKGQEAVLCMQVADNTVVSGSRDGILRVWNVGTGECLHTLTGHTKVILCLALDGRKVVSGSDDATLRLWDIDDWECQQTLTGHERGIHIVRYSGKHVVSLDWDYLVKVWDPLTGQCLHSLQTPPLGNEWKYAIDTIQFNGHHVVADWLDHSIYVWDVETGECLHTLEKHCRNRRCKIFKDNIIFAEAEYHTIKIWDITSRQCLCTLQGPNQHEDALNCMQIIGRFLITCSDDGKVKLWDWTSGQFIRDLVTLHRGGQVSFIRCSATKLICITCNSTFLHPGTNLLLLNFDTDVLTSTKNP